MVPMPPSFLSRLLRAAPPAWDGAPQRNAALYWRVKLVAYKVGSMSKLRRDDLIWKRGQGRP